MFRVRMQLGLNDAYLQGAGNPLSVGNPQGAENPQGAWKTRGEGKLREAGITIGVAVLDSGVVLHPDLKDAVIAFRNFTGGRGQGMEDAYGHGTHVCGILCGNGRLSRGRYRGIFPEGKLVVGKILDEHGNGTAEDMLAGLEWVYQMRYRYGSRILNIAVGVAKLREEQKIQKLQDMLQRLTDVGIAVVCAAGNHGPVAGSLSALGEGEDVISVGCHDGAFYRNDIRRCDRYCGRGKEKAVPRKPDIVAPGTCITSCSADYVSHGGKAYEERSGTSMSAPIVSGCLGRLLLFDPSLEPRDLKRILTVSAKDLGEPWNKQGWGMIQPRRMEEAARREMQKM